MIESTGTAEQTDKLGRRRTRVMLMLALLLIIQQSTYFARGDGTRLVDEVRLGAWAVMSIAVLLVLITGGFWFRKPEVRAMLEDEGARANRAVALGTGFVCAMVTAIVCYVMQAAWESVRARRSI